MIPILYSPFEKNFTTNGVGRLSECTSCTVTEERNGIYECEFVYPCNGKFYEQLIRQGGIIGVIHDDEHDIQPFDIYRYSEPINGMVTFNAHHISYRLNGVIDEPFTADTCADAMDGLLSHAITECPFDFWTNKNVSATFTIDRFSNVRELLAGQQGSILDVYGKGEYEFDKWDVKLYVNRGLNRGVTIRYGKNMVDFERTMDDSGCFNAVAPYWKSSDGTETVILPEGLVANTSGVIHQYPWEYTINGEYMTDEHGEILEFRPFILKTLPLDMSNNWQEAPTVDELRAAAVAYLTNNEPWIPSDNIKINFVQLWQTPEYENVAALQRVKLCDTVSVYYPELLVTNASVKVIKVVYNVITEQYDEMELGEAKTGIIDYITAPIETMVENGLENERSFTVTSIANAIANERAFTEDAIENATELIRGGLGGYVVMNANADGEPQEILIMDTDDINTAVHVIRMNKNGIGFSTNGYEGPYTSAWTINGAFNADFITAGTMLANRIYGGTLTIGGLNNQSGVIVVKNSSNTEVGRWNNAGITLPMSNSSSDYAKFDANGFRLHLDGIGDAGSSVYRFYSGITSPYYPSAESGETLGLFGRYTETGVMWDFDLQPTEFTIARGVGNNGYDTKQYFSYSTYGGLDIHDFDQNRYMTYAAYPSGDALMLSGALIIYGNKSKCVKTEEYSDRLLYCYETPTPMFGDIGEGVIDETGFCYIFLDSVFAETISTNQYQVFLQKYGEGDCWISERKGGYFVVQGTAGLRFGWELKAKQKNQDQLRLEKNEDPFIPITPDYGQKAAEYFLNLEEGRQEA